MTPDKIELLCALDDGTLVALDAAGSYLNDVQPDPPDGGVGGAAGAGGTPSGGGSSGSDAGVGATGGASGGVGGSGGLAAAPRAAERATPIRVKTAAAAVARRGATGRACCCSPG